MSSHIHYLGAGLAVSLASAGCAGWDNPTALEDLQPVAEFEIEAERVETFEAVEVHVHISEGGAPLTVADAQLEIEHEASGAVRTVAMEPTGEGYATNVLFFGEGEHHLHFMGIPHQHHLMWELGEHEVDVHNAHRIIGPYWVELEVSPAPVLEGATGHVHLRVFALQQDGTPGAAATELEVELEVHAPNGLETPLIISEEEPGSYEAEFGFGSAGMYELHVAIEIDGEHQDGEFHLPVLAPDGDEPGDEGGDGHDHGD